MKTVAVLLADGFEEVEALTPIDLLRRGGVKILVAGVNGRDIVAAHDVRINTDLTVDELSVEQLDGVVLPGGMPGSINLATSDEVKELVLTLAKAGKMVAAICAAPAKALGSFGLLEGKRFTCYPGNESEVVGGKFVIDPVVVDGNIITSRGVGTAAVFSLELLRYLVGSDTANKIAQATLLA